MSTQFGRENNQEEFPILCETCLGENPFVRMSKEPHGKACKICERPFTVYRWRPGAKARYKKTELCHTCAKLKNVCQTCVLDLKYGLPVQVRDSTLAEEDKMVLPESDVGKEYVIEQHERGLGVDKETPYAKMKPEAMLEKLARRAPYYKRNAPHACSFFARGACNRGTLCPYRHEMPVTGDLANQNIKDRYYGHNDPVAKKMMNRYNSRAPPLVTPEDKTITTLWVGGVDEKVSEPDVRNTFAKYGSVSSVRMVQSKNCAFITFVNRSDCEDAARMLHNNLVINGTHLKLTWGKRRSDESSGGGGGGGATNNAVSAPPGMGRLDASFPPPPPPPGMAAPPGVTGSMLYPSQDPRNLAAKLPT